MIPSLSQSPANKSIADTKKSIDAKISNNGENLSPQPKIGNGPDQSSESDILDAIEGLSLRLKETFQKH